MIRYLYITFLSLFFLSPLKAADYYWVNGQGNWSDYAHHWATASGGSVFHSQVPTNLDNVFFDQNSGLSFSAPLVSIDQTIIYCNSLDLTGVSAWTRIESSLSSVSIKIFGSLTLAGGARLSFTGDVNFESTHSGNTIRSNGNFVRAAHINFNGVGGTWELLDNYDSGRDLIHNAGHIISNGYNVRIGNYVATTTAIASLDLGTSEVILLQDWTVTNPSLFIDADSATIILQQNARNMTMFNPLTCHRLIARTEVSFIMKQSNIHAFLLESDASITISTNSLAVDSLTFTEGKSYKCSGQIFINENGSLKANGTCSAPILLEGNTDFSITKTNGIVSVDYVYLKSAIATGGATFNAIHSIDMGNVTGWNIESPIAKTLYWIGGSGNWSDPLHWSTSSGGAANVGGCAPSYLDDVYFDQNSFSSSNNEVTLNLKKTFCNSMYWNNVTGNPRLYANRFPAKQLYIQHNLKFDKQQRISLEGTEIVFNGNTGGNTINTSNLLMIDTRLLFDGVGGAWRLLDSLRCGTITFKNGDLNTNNYNIHINSLLANINNIGYSKFTMNASVVEIYYSWRSSSNFTVDEGTSTVISWFSGLSSSSDLYNVIMSADAGYLEGNIFIHKLEIKANVAINSNQSYDSLVVYPGKICTINSSLIRIEDGTIVSKGTCASMAFFNSPSGMYFSKNAGVVNLKYVEINNCSTQGGATFNVANGSILGSSTGWNATPTLPRNLYWVNGSGNWNDPAHWSLSSGGQAGECAPTQIDNVFFNQASGIISSLNVTGTSNCKNLDCSMLASVFNTVGSINIYGSLWLNEMNASKFDVSFLSDESEIISSKGNDFNIVSFLGKGTWVLLNNFTAKDIYHRGGELNLNGNVLTLKGFYYGSGSNSPVLNITSSKLQFDHFYFSGDPNTLTLKAQHSLIEFKALPSSSAPQAPRIHISGSSSTNGFSFGKILCSNSNYVFTLNGKNIVENLEAYGGALISDDNVFDTLTLTPGRTYMLNQGSVQTINDQLLSPGTAGFPVELISDAAGSPAYIRKTNGTLCLNHLYLRDIHASGGASFYAGTSGANVSGNAGWIFSSCEVTSTDRIISDDDYLIYPVPSHGFFYVDCSVPQSGNILSLIDATGEEWFQSELSDVTNKIDLSTIPAGFYYVIIQTGHERMTKKIMVY